MSCQILEFFAGIGGLHTAWPEAQVTAAIDINRQAREVYLRHLTADYHIREIASLRAAEVAAWPADLWWLSPPCQPYCRRGNQLDADDPRTAAFRQLLDILREIRPAAVALENVPGFECSRSHAQLIRVLDECGYFYRGLRLCPTQFNWPNRRDRYYLIASQRALPAWQPLPQYQLGLQHLVDHSVTLRDAPGLWLSAETVTRFETAIHRVNLQDARMPTACFTSSYGKTIVGSGSYLEQARGYRRFTPREVARLLGFPASFTMEGMSNRAAWRLLGNSLSLPVVRYMVSHLPQGPCRELPWLTAAGSLSCSGSTGFPHPAVDRVG